MSRSTAANTITEIYTDLGGTTPNVTGVTINYDHEPVTWAAPVAVTVSYAGQDALYWHIAVKVYVQATDDAKTAHDTLVGLLPLVMAKLIDIGPDQWTVDLVKDDDNAKAHYLAVNILEVPRADLSP